MRASSRAVNDFLVRAAVSLAEASVKLRDAFAVVAAVSQIVCLFVCV